VVQRFSVGFRGPLCIASGLSGVPFWRFAGGAMLGALGTMPLQLGAVRALTLLHGPARQICVSMAVRKTCTSYSKSLTRTLLRSRLRRTTVESALRT